MSNFAFKNKPIEIETSYVKETPQAGQIPEKIERVDSKMLISTIKDMPEFMRQLQSLNGRISSIERKVNAEGKKVKIIKISKKKMRTEVKDVREVFTYS